MRRLLAALLAGLLPLVASAGAAQRPRAHWGSSGGSFGARAGLADPRTFDGAFNFCRIAFRTASRGDGDGWGVDYPRADQNLSTRLSELTKTTISRTPDGQPNHVIIQLRDAQLFECPFVMMTEVGNVYFDEAETQQLRDYTSKGGFLWADDFWGERAWQLFEAQIRKVLPAGGYPIVDLPLEHPIFHQVMNVRKIPQIPSINFWARHGGQTSERPDSRTPHVRAISDEHGRVMVLMTHNTDFGDSWERESDNTDYFREFSIDGYAFGINVLVYAMTH